MNEHKRAILAAMDGGASTEVTKAALAAVDALTAPASGSPVVTDSEDETNPRLLIIEIGQDPDKSYHATVVGYPGCRARSVNREAAIDLAMSLLWSCIHIRSAS